MDRRSARYFPAQDLEAGKTTTRRNSAGSFEARTAQAESCFSSRPFILCGLPIRRPPAEQLVFEQRNGHFLLQVTGHPDYGLLFASGRCWTRWLGVVERFGRIGAGFFKVIYKKSQFFLPISPLTICLNSLEGFRRATARVKILHGLRAFAISLDAERANYVPQRLRDPQIFCTYHLKCTPCAGLKGRGFASQRSPS